MMTEMQKKGYADGYSEKVADESLQSRMMGLLTGAGKQVGNLAMFAPPALGLTAGYLMSKATSPSKMTEEKAQKEIQLAEEKEMYYALLEKQRRAGLKQQHLENGPKTRTLHV